MENSHRQGYHFHKKTCITNDKVRTIFFLNWRFLTRDYKKYIHKLTVKTLQVYNSLAFFFVKMARAQKRNLQTDLGWRLSHIWDVFMPRGLRGLVPSSSKQRRGEVREIFGPTLGLIRSQFTILQFHGKIILFTYHL